EADVRLAGPVQDRRADGARLAEQGDVAGSGHRCGEAGVKVARRVDDAQAVRPYDAQVPAADLAYLVLQRLALGAEFGKPRGDDARSLDMPFDAFTHHRRHRAGRGGDDGQIHGDRNLGQARVTKDAVDRAPFRVDREDNAAERVLQQVAHEDAANAAG